jgi:hypothetical protein
VSSASPQPDEHDVRRAGDLDGDVAEGDGEEISADAGRVCRSASIARCAGTAIGTVGHVAGSPAWNPGRVIGPNPVARA